MRDTSEKWDKTCEGIQDRYQSRLTNEDIKPPVMDGNLDGQRLKRIVISEEDIDKL